MTSQFLKSMEWFKYKTCLQKEHDFFHKENIKILKLCFKYAFSKSSFLKKGNLYDSIESVKLSDLLVVQYRTLIKLIVYFLSFVIFLTSWVKPKFSPFPVLSNSFVFMVFMIFYGMIVICIQVFFSKILKAPS